MFTISRCLDDALLSNASLLSKNIFTSLLSNIKHVTEEALKVTRERTTFNGTLDWVRDAWATFTFLSVNQTLVK